ncbi:hypothetical protein KFU94_46885 [Chloroflexi bacterium TSY]|nr:hypothetical protein [Chloroflexi bacterium TSY]
MRRTRVDKTRQATSLACSLLDPPVRRSRHTLQERMMPHLASATLADL